MSTSFERLRRMRFGNSACSPAALPDKENGRDQQGGRSYRRVKIGLGVPGRGCFDRVLHVVSLQSFRGPAVGRSPESRTTNGAHVWIPGSLAPLAPRGMTRYRARKETSLAQVGVFRMFVDIGLGEGAQRLDLQPLAAGRIEHAAD